MKFPHSISSIDVNTYHGTRWAGRTNGDSSDSRWIANWCSRIQRLLIQIDMSVQSLVMCNENAYDPTFFTGEMGVAARCTTSGAAFGFVADGNFLCPFRAGTSATGFFVTTGFNLTLLLLLLLFNCKLDICLFTFSIFLSLSKLSVSSIWLKISVETNQQ